MANTRRNRKGTTFTVGQILVFVMGVAIFLSMFFIFNNYQNHFIEINTHNQLDEAMEIVVSNLIKLSQKKGNTTAYIRMEFGEGTLPERIGNYDYWISFSQKNITIETAAGFSTTSAVYGLNESLAISGTVFSSSGSFVIYKSRDRIIISNATIV
ncbi:MAG: hypothetical protein ACXABY_15615 [Candidatus Thorarchaeota archaeon]|jgi:hypothetical protein